MEKEGGCEPPTQVLSILPHNTTHDSTEIPDIWHSVTSLLMFISLEQQKKPFHYSHFSNCLFYQRSTL